VALKRVLDQPAPISFEDYALMKRVRLILREPDINKAVGNELELLLDEQANVIDVIKKVDEIVSSRGRFPVEGCRSLLHLTFHPLEQRFYKHVALTAYSKSERFLDVRRNPHLTLPDGAVIVLALTLCQSEWEEIVSHE